MINIEYQPHEKQQSFHHSKRRFKAFIGGIGSGKTLAGCWEALRLALTQDGSLGMILAPTYTMLRDSTMRTFFEVCPASVIKNHNKTKNELTLSNGSEILFRSADEPDRLRGPNLAWIFMDEAGMMTGEAFKILMGRLRQKGYAHRLFVTTTPKGFNWLYGVFVEGATEEYEVIHATTMDNKGNLPDGFIQGLEAQYSGLFYRQELLGEFVGFEGLVYDDFSEHEHVIDEAPSLKRYIAGVDVGFTNPTALLIIGLDSDDRAYVLEEFYKSRITEEQFLQLCRDYRDRYEVDTFYCDPSEAALIQTMNNHGIPAAKGDNDIVPGIMEISGRLKIQKDNRPRLYVHRRCVNLINEFHQYRYPDTKEGKPQQDKPLKVFDHALDALRYALYTSSHRGEMNLIGTIGRGYF